jgi:hypothetical protein
LHKTQFGWFLALDHWLGWVPIPTPSPQIPRIVVRLSSLPPPQILFSFVLKPTLVGWLPRNPWLGWVPNGPQSPKSLRWYLANRVYHQNVFIFRAKLNNTIPSGSQPPRSQGWYLTNQVCSFAQKPTLAG